MMTAALHIMTKCWLDQQGHLGANQHQTGGHHLTCAAYSQTPEVTGQYSVHGICPPPPPPPPPPGPHSFLIFDQCNDLTEFSIVTYNSTLSPLCMHFLSPSLCACVCTCTHVYKYILVCMCSACVCVFACVCA